MILYLSNKTVNINGKNWLVYNQVLGQQSRRSKTANITLVELHLKRYTCPYQRRHAENHNSMQMRL